MAVTDSGCMEVLKVNPNLEAEKLLHLLISQTNTLTGIVSWPPYFTPFHLIN